MVDRGTLYQIYGTYVEHKGRFAHAVNYHPIDRSLHHVFEFEADYAIKTEITAEAQIILGSKVIDTKGGSNDFYGVGTSVREVARYMKDFQSDYPGATIHIVAKIEQSPCILAPVENPDFRRQAASMPRDWYLAEDKDKLEKMVKENRFSIPIEEFPGRLKGSEEHIVVWDSSQPADFTPLIKFASDYGLSAEKLQAIMEYLQ